MKLCILIWFLAPFGYNASDIIFENVRRKRSLLSLSNIYFQVISPACFFLQTTIEELSNSVPWFRFWVILACVLKYGEYLGLE